MKKVSILAAGIYLLSAAAALGQSELNPEQTAIKNWTYGQVDDSENVINLLPYYLGVADYCVEQSQVDPKLIKDLKNVSATLGPVPSDIHEHLFDAGVSGLLADPSEAVPTASISDVAMIRGLIEEAFCMEFAAIVRGQVHSLVNDCSVNDAQIGFSCPSTRQIYMIGPDEN
jgi:hypothetical protein